MKRIFTLVLLSAALLAKSAPANNSPVNAAAVKAFEASFGKSKEAQWSSKISGYQVAFVHKGQYITAEYNAAGKLRWYKMHIASTQLPAALQLALTNHFSNYWIADVVEQSGGRGANYKLTLESGRKKIALNGNGDTWKIVKITSKA